MTPEVIAYKKIGNHKVEFSYGTDFSQDHLIGITVDDMGNKNCDLSRVYQLSELKDKIEEIKNI